MADEDIREDDLVLSAQDEIGRRHKNMGDDYPFRIDDSGRAMEFITPLSRACLLYTSAISRFLVPASRPGGSHSSRPAIADGLQQPTRKSSGSGQAILPYLVLLRVGFSLPLRLPATRCALTAPFHPYLRIRRSAGGIFSVALIRRTGFEPAPPAVNRHAALWRPDFPPVSGRLPIRQATPAIIPFCVRERPMY